MAYHFFLSDISECAKPKRHFTAHGWIYLPRVSMLKKKEGAVFTVTANLLLLEDVFFENTSFEEVERKQLTPL